MRETGCCCTSTGSRWAPSASSRSNRGKCGSASIYRFGSGSSARRYAAGTARRGRSTRMMAMPTEPEPWRVVCRAWLALLSADQLERLRVALLADSPQLCQGATTEPPNVHDPHWPCAAACPVAFGDWLGEDHVHVEDVEARFAARCGQIDGELGEVGGCRYLFEFIDCLPRPVWIAGLLGEVRAEQERRAGA